MIIQVGENEELNSCGSESSITEVIGELRKQPLGIISEVKSEEVKEFKGIPRSHPQLTLVYRHKKRSQ